MRKRDQIWSNPVFFWKILFNIYLSFFKKKQGAKTTKHLWVLTTLKKTLGHNKGKPNLQVVVSRGDCGASVPAPFDKRGCKNSIYHYMYSPDSLLAKEPGICFCFHSAFVFKCNWLFVTQFPMFQRRIKQFWQSSPFAKENGVPYFCSLGNIFWEALVVVISQLTSLSCQ